MIKKEHRLSVQITTRMFESLKLLAERYEVSIGQIIRESIHDYCRKRGLKS